MNQEVTVTLKITTTGEKIFVSAVQTTAGQEQVLEVATVDKGPDTAVVDLPPPPQVAAFEYLETTDLPSVPEIDAAGERAALESLASPDLPPVPDIPDPQTTEALASSAIPDLPPVPEVPQDEVFN